MLIYWAVAVLFLNFSLGAEKFHLQNIIRPDLEKCLMLPLFEVEST